MRIGQFLAGAAILGWATAALAAAPDPEWQKLLAAHESAMKSGVCEVHGAKMTKKEVPIRWGYEQPPGPGEPTALQRMRLFPNYLEFIGRGCCKIEGKDSEKIWICPVCKEKAAAWAKDQR